MSPSTLHFLAIIADLYTPFLLLLSLTVCAYQWRKGFTLYWLRLLVLAIASYAVMFIDQGFFLWGRLGLDFSTHTATSLALVLFIAAWGSPKLAYVLWASLFAYCNVMYLEGYHTWMDMVSTFLIMSVIFFAVFKLTQGFTLKK